MSHTHEVQPRKFIDADALEDRLKKLEERVASLEKRVWFPSDKPNS